MLKPPTTIRTHTQTKATEISSQKKVPFVENARFKMPGKIILEPIIYLN